MPAADDQKAELLSFDGGALMLRGDLVLILYAGDARAHRTKWIFDQAARLLETTPSIVALNIIPPTSQPPDAAGRQADTDGYARFGSRIRRVVAVVEGSPFRVSLVRMVLNTYVKVLGKASFFYFPKDLEAAIATLFEAKSNRTPSAGQIRADVATLREALSSQRSAQPSRRP